MVWREKPAAQQGDCLQIVLRNVRQLQAMIEDLLEVTQVQEGKLSIELEPVSLHEAIEYAVDTRKSVAKEKEIVVSVQCSAELPMAYANATRVRQVLTILLDNALKFTPTGGLVNVGAGVHQKNEGFLLVKVSDTGCGISPETVERVFGHLYQVSDLAIESCRAGRKGLGLGLQIAKELVTRLGGEIWVNSEQQKGSRFFFTLPVFP